MFYCNFERILENKEKKVDENTINYYRKNNLITIIMTFVEIFYCLCCMTLYLLIVYWSNKNKNDVIVGQDSEYESDIESSEEEDIEDNYRGLNFEI